MWGGYHSPLIKINYLAAGDARHNFSKYKYNISSDDWLGGPPGLPFLCP